MKITAEAYLGKEEKINKVLKFTKKEKLKEASDLRKKLSQTQQDELHTKKTS